MSSALGCKKLIWMTMLQQLPVNLFEWIKDTFQFNKDFIKNYNEETVEGYFLKLIFNILKNYYELHNDLPFLPKRTRTEKVEKFL